MKHIFLLESNRALAALWGKGQSHIKLAWRQQREVSTEKVKYTHYQQDELKKPRPNDRGLA